jgi:hypothetical protein
MYERAGRLKEPSVQLYLNDLSMHVGERLHTLGTRLLYFMDLGALDLVKYSIYILTTSIGIPAIVHHQQQGASNLQNLSTIAIFLSGGMFK